MSTDIDFDKLTPAQQEAYIPRGQYKDPAALDQGNAPKGAPTGPVPYSDDSIGQPDPERAEAEKADDKPVKKRTTK